jgi:hypothetical protein
VTAVAGLTILPAFDQSPELVFDTLIMDVGTLTDGEVATRVFNFTNKGSGTLEIAGIEASCGCTSALLSADRIAPGGRGKLEIKLMTENLTVMSRSLAEVVTLSKTITVSSNDAKKPKVVLTITATVAPEIAPSELTIYFGIVPPGQEVVKDLILRISDERPIRLLGAESTDANVAVRLEPVAGSNGKEVRVVAVQKATMPEGLHVGNIVIKTSSKLKPVLRIPVRGIVRKSG